ncbi:MAG: hypothetical protein K0R09_466 [Clostridiales bacterium]|nr:hypothetical protein [Clostridiales bacterium]
MANWIMILLRTSILFFLALILIRILGKGNPLRMTPFRFVSYTVIGVIIALISTNIVTNTVLGLVALGVWIVYTIAIDYLSIKSKAVHDLVNGKETVLIKVGKVMEENLIQVRLTGEELLRELRSKNVFKLADVEFAVMESTGDVNILLKSDKKPITPHDLQRKVSPAAEAQTVILDGNALDEPLSNMGLNRNWLSTELEKVGVSEDNVFIGQVDSSGDLYLDLFDDSIQLPQPKVKELLYANLEQSQADFLKFALETQDENIKAIYSNNANRIKDVMNKLKPYLLS